ncbi:MAG: F0F1 ATP synthase subunit delta [Trueperaceae bacterium]
MSFDWFTFIAQLVNFALLLVLLRVFLYRPVLNLMDQRQAQLAAAWDEARAAQVGASEEAARLATERAALAGERRERLAGIEQEAQELRQQRLERAELEASQERDRVLAQLSHERHALVASLTGRSAKVLVSELGASLADLADAELEEQAARTFVRRLAELPEAELVQLRESSADALVTTAFEPSEPVRQLLVDAVQQATGRTQAPRFETDPSLLFGAELKVGSVRVEASGRRRLAALESEFGAVLEQATHMAAQPGDTKAESEDD